MSVHKCLEIEFDDKAIFLKKISEKSMDIVMGKNHSEKIERNHYYLGRQFNSFYSIKLKKVPAVQVQSDFSSLPLKVISQYFFDKKVICAVIGCKGDSLKFTANVQKQAFDTGAMIAHYGFITLTGGLSGVMSKAAEGARLSFGETLGILPGSEKDAANPFIQIVLPSGIGIARNYLIAQAADILIALSGGRGTLEEMAFGLDFEKKVVSLDSWDIPGVTKIDSVTEIADHLNQIFKQNFLKSLHSKFE